MSKPLAGKRLFYARGQRAAMRGVVMHKSERVKIYHWSTWAYMAFLAGWCRVFQQK